MNTPFSFSDLVATLPIVVLARAVREAFFSGEQRLRTAQPARA